MPLRKSIWYLLTLRSRRGVLLLLAGMMGMAAFEVLGVASVMPFIAVAARPELIESQPLLHSVYQAVGAPGVVQFLFMLGAVMLTMLAGSNLLAAWVQWKLLSFTHRAGYEISRRLLQGYLTRPYAYFLAHNTALMSHRILTQVPHVTNGVLIPSMQLLARGMVFVALMGLLLMVNPVISLLLFASLGSFYVVIFMWMRKRIVWLGKQHPIHEARRHLAVSEVFAGIKDVKLLGRSGYFVQQFSTSALIAAQQRAAKETMALLPRYVLESLVFGAVFIIILWSIAQGNSLASILPTLGIYAVVGMRMMPMLQQLFHATAVIRANAHEMQQLIEVLNAQPAAEMMAAENAPRLLEKSIVLEGLSFGYEGGEKPVLDHINLTLQARKTTALVGETGSGKSTLADLVTGLLQPTGGKILVDDKALEAGDISGWQRGIGYVPQSIFLLDDTIRRNIAFGTPDELIDEEAVRRAAHAAQIDQFIEQELANGYETSVGERGVRLSGGQRQRIGLARALYHDPQLLVLDEATSALDNITERGVMDAIAALGGSKTILIIAHRLSTVKQCDHVVMLRDGRIEAEGTYDELLARSPAFARLAQQHAAPHAQAS